MGNCCPRSGNGGDSSREMSLGAAAVGGDGKSKDGQNGQPSSPALQWLLHNEIVESGEDVFKTDFSDGSMPVLHSMARKGNATAVKHLLSIDTQKITTKLEYGSRVPLHQAAAAREGRLETCKMLLDHDKTQIHVKTRDGSTPLHMLVQGDGDEASVLQLFIDVGGIDLVKAAKNDRSTLLHLSCSSGHSAFVSTILAMEPSMASMLDGSGRTCLHLAAEKGHAAVAQQLVDIDPTHVSFASQDDQGSTCLALAAIGGHSEVVKLLLRKDASLISIRDKKGLSPLDLCTQHGKTAGHWQAAAAILELDPALLDAQALHWATLHGQEEGVDLVLSLDKQAVSKVDVAGNTPLHNASSGGHLNMLNKLLQLTGSPGASNAEGETILHAACAAGQVDVVKMLGERYPQLLAAKNNQGQTCLFTATVAPDKAGKGAALAAASKRALAVAKELLAQDRGLLQERDARGMSVLHVAAASGRCEDLVFLYAETGGEELIRRPDANGDDALALAPPNIRDILESVLERLAEDAAAAATNV